SQPAPSAASNPQPAAASSSAAAVPSVIVPSASPSSTSKSVAEVDGRKANKAEKTPQPEKPAPAEKQEAVVNTLAVSGTSRIAQHQEQSPEIAPSFSVEAGGTPVSLSNLTSPVATSTPKAGAVEQSKLEALQLIKTAPLAYPTFAKSRNI